MPEPYSPPSGVRAAARRALGWIADGKAGDGFTATGRARARQLANGDPVSRETIGRMANYFGRHASDRDATGFRAGEDGFPTPGRVAWDAWGGDPGRTWANRILNEERSQMTDYRRTDDGIETPEREERRIAKLELRTDEATGNPVLEGYATVYDYRYDLGGGPDAGGFTEVIARGAAAKSAKEADVRLLVNHDGVPLARTKSGTLSLESDDIGLRVSAQLDPANPAAAEVRSAMERGDLDQMSFAFKVLRQEWSEDYSVRTISEVKLYDVSVVTYPANPATVVQLQRSDDDQTEQAEQKPAAGRSLAMARRQAEADKSRRRH